MLATAASHRQLALLLRHLHPFSTSFLDPQPVRHLSTLPLRWGPTSPSKIWCCVSGGVDSSVAARLLLEAGHDILPVYMRNWDSLDEDSGSGGCEWEKEWSDVERLCRESLGGVKPRLLDFSREYWREVFEPALDDWGRGVTPNPDVSCNRQIKFSALPSTLLSEHPDSWIATGHYAQLLPSPLSPDEPALYRGSFAPKDQSYYLATSPIDAFKRSIFPLGGMRKDEVRELAKKWDLHTSEKKESMGICFVGVRKNFNTFIDSYLPPSPGNIEDLSGQVVGKHQGLWRFTIGEGAKMSGFSQKMFVGAKDLKRNVIVIVPGGHSMLQCTGVSTSDFQWISPLHPPPEVDSPDGLHAKAQTRSLQAGALSDCIVHQKPDGSLTVSLKIPIKGVSPGQAVVLYDGDWCLGGGTIAETRTLHDEPR